MPGNEQDDDRERRLDEAAAEYLRLRASERPFDRQQWLASQYPDLAEELAEFVCDVSLLSDPPVAPQPVGAIPMNSPTLLRQSTHLHSTIQPGSSDDCYNTLDSEPGTSNNESVRIRSSQAGKRYQLRSLLGSGGMGEVWLAEDSVVGRQIAIKKIRSTGLEKNPGIEARFLFESQVMGRLEHPCIVPVHDFGRDDAGDMYSVMKLVKGQSLKQRLIDFHKTKTDDWPEHVEFRRLLGFFVRICHAVAYAHSRGVLHRDIKPDNIMLGSYSEAMLLDWGLAKAIDHPDPELSLGGEANAIRPTSGNSSSTGVGAIMGSPVYMAPEVAAGNSASVDERTDVYLLGATLYELITGRAPRIGTNVFQMVELAQTSMPPGPRSIDPRIPKPLEAICFRAMALDPKQRYADALALASDIELHVVGEPVTAYREPPLQNAWRWCRRHRRGLARSLMGVLLAATAGLAAVSANRAHQLQLREVAREQLSQFRRLTDEAQFFAANSDAVSEQTPYYNPQQALQLSDQALNVASLWGPDGRALPLVEERNTYANELHAFLLFAANLYQREPTARDSQLVALRLLDQAAALPVGPSRAYHVIRERCLRSLDRGTEADQEGKLTVHRDSDWTALDWFLEGEYHRQQASELASGNRPTSGETTARANSIDIEQAALAYQNAIQLDPLNHWARYQLARCYLKMQRGPEAVEALGACIALRPTVPWAYSTRGLVRGLMGEFELADRDLAQALQLSPAFRPAHLNRGLVAFLEGRDQDALLELDLALAPPDSEALTEAVFYRAQVHLRRGDLVAAQQDSERFLKARPTFLPALLLDANIRFRQGDDEAGMRSIDTIAKESLGRTTSPDEVQLRIVRGQALKKLAVNVDSTTQRRVLELALREFETVGDQVPTPDATSINDMLGLADKSIEEYSKRLEMTPEDVALRNMRGNNYVKLERFELAADDFLTSLELSPENAEAHTLLGYVRALQGDERSAELEAAKGALYGGQDPLALHNAACIYAKLADMIPTQRVNYENAALAFLDRAIKLSRQAPGGIDLVEIVRSEPAFESLKARPEFQRLLE